MRTTLIVTGVAVVVVATAPSAVGAPLSSYLRPHHAFSVDQRPLTDLPNSAYGVTWVTDSAADSVSEYASGASGAAAPVVTIVGADTGLSDPTGVVLGPHGNIYVANAGNNSITEYGSNASGDAAPATTIVGPSTALDAPSSIGIAGGQVLVTDPSENLVEAFTAGSSGDELPAETIAGAKTDLDNPIALGINEQAGEMSVLNVPASGQRTLVSFDPGSAGNVAPEGRVVLSATTVVTPSSIAVDGLGYTWVTDRTGDGVYAYFPDLGFLTSKPIFSIKGAKTGLDEPTAVSVDPLERVVVGNAGDHTVRTFTFVYSKSSTLNAAPTHTITGVGSDAGSPSGVVSFGAAPSAPTRVRVVAGNKKIAISWQPPASSGGGVLAYQIEAFPIDAIFSGGPAASTGGFFTTMKTSYTVHHVADGQRYLVAVAAYNGDGASNAGGKTVVPGAVPSAPREVHAVGGAASITLIWDSPRSNGGFHITRYQIQYVTCLPASPTCKTHTVHVGGYRHQVTLRNLSTHTMYRLRVVAQNKRGESHPSRIASARTT